jgi:hypothetical protein
MQANSTWKPLYKAGAIAALVAALLFRRNIGAEVSLFTGANAIPKTVTDWFSLLQTRPFVGMSFLAVFDLANYFLEGLIFLALAALFWQAGKNQVAVATACGMVGIAVNFSTNISISMLSISQQYAAASSEVQKSVLLSAGQALLTTHDPLAVTPSTGAFLSLLLIALAAFLFSIVLMPSQRTAAILGLLASGCDLTYCLTVFWFHNLPIYLFLAAAGLLWMLWHLLIARILLQQSKEQE